MTDCAKSEISKPISPISKSGILIQDILDFLSLRTKYTTRMIESLSNSEISLTIHYFVSGSINELIL